MPLLDIKKLTMRFGGLTAVSEVDLDVPAGSICSVIGPNGAGKTTVFNAVTGVYVPTEGTIGFEGRQLRRPFGWRVVLLCGVGRNFHEHRGALVASVDVERPVASRHQAKSARIKRLAVLLCRGCARFLGLSRGASGCRIPQR